MLVEALLLSVPLLVSGWPLTQKHASGVTSVPSTANGQTFDYIIVGGGLAGLTVAGRLAEDPSKTVLVVEAGNDDRTNPAVFDIYEYGAAFGTSLAWAWDTDLGRLIRGGRTLGGSSSINGAIWTRGTKEQYDAFSKLLGDEDAEMNWNFDSLFSYMKKSEGFTTPDKQQRAKGAKSINDFHGFSGPVQVAFPEEMFGGPQQPAFIDAMHNLTGIIHCSDADGGNSDCATYMPQSINPHDNDHRSSSATAYLSPVENERTNWLTLVNHQVTRVLLSDTALNVTATGVQFKKSDDSGDTFTANARQEVILAAGAIGTPQLLQLSGIGDPSILSPLGIDVKVDLPTVGRNFQERSANNITHSTQPSFDKGGRGPSDAIAFASLQELFSENGGSNGSVTADEVADFIMALYPTWAQSQAPNGMNADALTTIFGIQAELIVKNNAPIMELFFNTDETGDIFTFFWNLLPFSRGNVTITDTSVFTQPKVTVNWFSVDFDLAVQTAGARLTRKVHNHPVFSSILSGETIPGADVVANDEHGGTDAAWQAWIQAPAPTGFEADHHEIGSAAMMRRDLGGVVDGKLRVYDTMNLRVVDASMLPLHISAHPSCTLYGVAEKAADIIKSGV